MDLATYRITINPTGLSGAAAATYKRKVHEHLRWIYRTKSGKLLFRSIKFYNRPVTITPYTNGDCNATGGGTAVGGDGTVSYSPDTFSLHGACSATTSAQKSGLLWDEILFHELIHVFRVVSGKWNQTALGFGLHRYTDREEFNAVLVTNIYISDRSNKIKSGLRANHQSFAPLSADFDGAFEFFSTSTQTFELIKKFCADHPFFAKKLADDLAKSPFNPLRDYYADTERARRLSQNAGSRDVVGITEQIQELTARAIRLATGR